MPKFLIFFFLISLPYLAQAQFCRITYFTREGEKFWLIMDGERKNDQAAANVSVTLFGITHIGKVSHQVKIIFEDESLGSIDTSFRTNYRRNQTFMIFREKDGFDIKHTKNAMSLGLF